jgi:hypothetical protein
MRIKKGGTTREVSEYKYNSKWKKLGYEILEEKKEEAVPTREEVKAKAEELGIEFDPKISTKNLLKKIEGAENA